MCGLIRKCIIAVVTLVLLLPVVSLASGNSSDSGEPVPYGITCSRDGQYIPVFDNINSNKRIDLLMPDKLCALDFSRLQGKNYWYHIVYYDDYGFEQAGYVKESNFEQLTSPELLKLMKDPDTAMLISQLIALRETSSLFLGEETLANTVSKASAGEKKSTYILNTNTKKFHYPDCKSVKQMKQKNKKEYTGTRDEIIKMGYVPCKNCDP